MEVDSGCEAPDFDEYDGMEADNDDSYQEINQINSSSGKRSFDSPIQQNEINNVYDDFEMLDGNQSDDESLLELERLSLVDGDNGFSLGNYSENDSRSRNSSRNLQPFPEKPYYWMNDVETINYILENFDEASFYIMHNGKIVNDFNEFIRKYSGEQLVKYSFHLRLRGGKGGFGSLLRSFRVNKSTNKLMMRDLNGRRMASVDEEAKLKRYLERQARKEHELREKRKAKLAKLTAGPAKHQFEDQEYLSKREEILDKTEDACEAGFAYLKELKRQKSQQKEKENGDTSDEDDNEDIKIEDLFNDRGGRKRKIEEPTIADPEKRKKRDYEEEMNDQSSDSEDDSDNEPDEEQLQAIRDYFNNKPSDENEEKQGESSQTADKQTEPEEKDEIVKVKPPLKIEIGSSNIDDLPKIDLGSPCEYSKVNIDDFNSANELELLGLEHLKFALNSLGLKSGGSLTERAARLWQVKGLTLEQYPKHLLTIETKKKLLEQQAPVKKTKKSKKN